jgi:rfaE bifunctional protein nucleotidyltransferase chain/domain
MEKTKIVELEKLSKIISILKKENKKIVLSHGVFDLLHIGHILHFKSAKKFGDVLIVTLTPDKYVNKGPHRPVFTETLRAESIAALEDVDYVAINKWPTSVKTIKLLKPNIYSKGIDYSNLDSDITGGIISEKEAILSVSGELKFTDEITFSSSSLINKHFQVHSKETNDYLRDFSKRYRSEEVISYLDKLKDLKILVIGETIIDEYHYGKSIGKSNKESMVALKYLSNEKFAGGTLAIANHVANFCENVDLFTLLGDKDSQEGFINKNLNDRIKKFFYYKKDSPTIVKRRFIDKTKLRKLLEFYFFNENNLDQLQSKELCDHLRKILPKYDLVIVSDFGHGMFDKNIIDIIAKKSKFVGINTQSNAGNWGYNTISKYPKADYICIDEPEIRLENRDRNNDLNTLIKRVSKKLSCNNVTITRGIYGCTRYYKDEFIEIPAFSDRVIDSMGAGDAFLSITTPLAAIDTPSEIIGFIGNAVGAIAVTVVGNKKPIDKVFLFKYITSLMK